MKIKALAIILGLSLAITLGACKKKEETPPPPVPKGIEPTQSPHSVVMPKGEIKVVVPDNVKGKWSSVKLSIKNKETNKEEQVTVKLHSEYQIPGTKLKIKVGDFLPDFKMDGLTITSASTEPKNPAVNVTIYENNKKVFKGWLYSKFPDIHPFQHEKFSITLIEGIKAG
ncbi:MAG TPA: DUF2155 domain-containing protein [Nitrospirae bacterium]|nr:DUF2155 domain-containing protein [Nitrospirota bacterium]